MIKTILLVLLLTISLSCSNDITAKRACIGTYEVEYLHVSGQIMTKQIHVTIDCDNVAVLNSQLSSNDGSYWANVYNGPVIIEKIYGATDVISITFVK